MKKKVLFLLEAFDKGGIEKVTLDIVNHLDPEKYDVTVQTFWYGGHCQSQVVPHVKVIPFFFKRYVRGIIRLIEYLPPRLLYRLFVRGDYDVELAASDGGAAKVISGSTNRHSRKVCWVHMDVVERGSRLKEFQNAETARPIYEKFDVIAPVSAAALSQFRRKFGEYPDMRAVHNPLLDEEIREKAAAFAVERGETTEFVTVGRLAVEKGFDRLIEAVSRLKQEEKVLRVRIVGDGSLKASLQKQIRNCGVEDVVVLQGFAENPYPYMAAADWYICTSLDEAYPLTLGEAFSLGRPVMGTDCAGVREWLGESVYGILMENSADGIYRAMRDVLEMTPAEFRNWQQRAAEKAGLICFERQLACWQKDMLGE